MPGTRYVADRAIYEQVLLGAVARTRAFLWIATADIKDLYVSKGRRMVPFLEILADLVREGVAVRLIHAREPGPRFREEFDRFPSLVEGMERILCPRVHFKCVVVDGVWAYSGSANLTGAGMGAKGDNRRNFEAGIVTDEARFVEAVMEQFDAVWRGAHCGPCERKAYCADYRDLL